MSDNKLFAIVFICMAVAILAMASCQAVSDYSRNKYQHSAQGKKGDAP